MNAVTTLQDAIAGAAATRRPVGCSASGVAGGTARGVVIADGQRAHERAQPPARRGHGLVRRRPPRAGDGRRRRPGPRPRRARASTPATRPRSRWEPGGGAQHRQSGASPWSRSRIPAGAGSARRSASCRQASRSFRGPRGRRIRGAIEHTAPLPRGSSGGPLVDPDGNLLGLNSLRLDGGLILAVPAGAAVKERDPCSSRAARPPRPPPARRGDRAPARGAPAAERRGPAERDGLLVRAVEDGSPGRRGGIETR